MKKSCFIISLVVTLICVSCDKAILEGPLDENVLDGQIEGLSFDENIQFLNGDEAFAEVFTSSNGLGPLFVANSCVTCHAGDGKGHPFTTLTRFGQIDASGNQYLNFGGPQLQNRALPGYTPEAIPSGATSAKLTPPITTGLGFLDAVTDADIIAMSDPNDADGDGISGVPNWAEIPPYVILRANAIAQNGKYIHRFGKKAAAYDLLHQTVSAYNQDMGITSTFEPIDTYSGLEVDPEVSNNAVNDVVFYLKTLKAPIQRDEDNVFSGKNIFSEIKCASCHKPTLKTGFSPIEAISNKEFHPFTDLLLHDMGSNLDDGYTEGGALTAEWRTPPLWGLGLAPDSQGGEYFLMHDGRARSIEEAILLHEGEAANSRSLYQNLSQTEKNNLIEFLNSL
ncbi:di-heme oxidoredictase family protein [Changchengzhania lutea]|uniref:di-heme oxidoredictase family protein n=1 Tax=Changchengzhania lutea TaxID=2049305 RepID=UPI00115CD33E|nr:di-heme oxidoredictase family protein [Changchengzhania lutea]